MVVRLEAVSSHLAAQINARTGRETITPDRVKPDDQLLDGFMLKPMNCPHHIKIFASQPHSYRDLPVRLAEFGTVYRWEQSGELNGMTRVRGFTQDDAHLFCTEDQVAAELIGCLALVKIVLTTLGMSDYRVRVGLRDPDSNKYTGEPENWDKAEAACREAAKTLGVAFTEEPGEAAFYGPKIDFVVKDVIGREWQLGTVQVDYNLPDPLRPHLQRRRQPAAPAGHDPPRALRLDGALLRRPDRALRRRLPGLARAGAGAPRAHQREDARLRPRAARAAQGRRRARHHRRAQRQARRQDPPRPRSRRCPTRSSWAPRRPRRRSVSVRSRARGDEGVRAVRPVPAEDRWTRSASRSLSEKKPPA